MPRFDAVVECPVVESFHVHQVAGMFDLALEPRLRREFHVELPELDEPWRIGAIVGPSGSGKSTIARQAYGAAVYRPGEWPRDQAVVDGFGDAGIRDITAALTAVGFSSPPAWLRPFACLSTGEQFRCELARALVAGGELVVFDEFTSVVDRRVAQVGSAAVSRAIRQGRFGRRFVAVTCHADVIPWLAPDWTLDMASGRLARGALPRPAIELEIRRCSRRLWRLFGPHHYLSGGLPASAECFAATWDGAPVAFCALVRRVGRGQSGWRVSRLVALPDYQGLGLGSRLLGFIAEQYRRLGEPVRITTSHPAMIAACERSAHWRRRGLRRPGGRTARRTDGDSLDASRAVRRATVSYEYQGRSMK